VSIVISAYNEDQVIGKKIENSLSLNYPKDKLEIIVISDCSIDRTDEIVKSFHPQGVVLISQDKRQGKSAGINAAIPKARGEIILCTDANAMLATNALKMIVGHFNDPQIGFVTGRTKYVSSSGNRNVEITSAYTTLEIFIKKKESELGSCVGADGAIFTIRKCLFTPLKPTDINDLVMPLNIVKQGYRGVADDNAFCAEEISRNPADEFQRQVRITSRTLRALFSNSDLFNPFRFPLFSFQLISHKVIRFLGPFFLLLLLISNIALLPSGLFYKILLAGQCLMYALAFSGIKITTSLLLIPVGFITMNCAFLKGWFHYISGKTYTTWDPPGRNSVA
jgi:cellulose synthase/poly-beta-1,6-N-acetylglucosamine synthase-like glycosyltransferase